MTAPRVTAADVSVPADHLDLLERPVVGVLTTVGPDGAPQSSLVWVDHDHGCARFNTTRERQKGRNLVTNPRASLLVVDPDDGSRFVQVRGDVELTEEGAVEHVDALTRAYTRHPAYYGYVYPADRRGRETRLLCRIRARRVTVDAVHVSA